MPRESKHGKGETFEELYALLEASVGKLEQGGLSLDESIALYEEGMRLARSCQERLDEAEQRITKLQESFTSLAPGNGARIRDEVPLDDDEMMEPEDGF